MVFTHEWESWSPQLLLEQTMRAKRAHAMRVWCEQQLSDIAKVFAAGQAEKAKGEKAKGGKKAR